MTVGRGDFEPLIIPMPVRRAARRQRWACGVALLVVATVPTVNAIRVLLDPEASTGGKIVRTAVIGAFVVLLRVLNSLQPALRPESADRLLAEDQRSHVLYLRSFVQDIETASYPDTRGVMTGEQSIARVLSIIGPVVAVQPPWIQVPTPGAAKGRVEAWQDKVPALMVKARLVVIRLGATPGVLWELEKARELLCPVQLLLLVPPDPWVYDRVRAAGIFPDLPALPPLRPRQRRSALLSSIACMSIHFDSDWHPCATNLVRPWWARRVSAELWLSWRWRFIFKRCHVAWSRELRRTALTAALVIALTIGTAAAVLRFDIGGAAPPRAIDAGAFALDAALGRHGMARVRDGSRTAQAPDNFWYLDPPPLSRTYVGADGCRADLRGWTFDHTSGIKELDEALRHLVGDARAGGTPDEFRYGHLATVLSQPVPFGRVPVGDSGTYGELWLRERFGLPQDRQHRVQYLLFYEEDRASKQLLIARVIVWSPTGPRACPLGARMLADQMLDRWRAHVGRSGHDAS